MAVFKSTSGAFASVPLDLDALVAVLESATATNDLILSMVAAGIPDFDRSSTDLYGRPAIIFLALAAPMPGNSSNCASVAVFKSTAAVGFWSAASIAAERRTTPMRQRRKSARGCAKRMKAS